MDLETTAVQKTNKARKCLILAGCMFNTFVAIGVLFSINALYVELLDVFQTTRKETSLVQTVFIGMTFVIGLLVGIVIRHVGIKISLMIGATLSALGFFIGWLATSVPYLIITVGVISGSGNSLIYISTIVLTAMTFQKRRSLALALLMVSAGVGQVLIPLLLGRLLDVYGWRGSLLIISGLYLNIVVSCVLTTSSLGADLPFLLPKVENTERTIKQTKCWYRDLKPMFLLCVFSMSICLAVADNLVVLFMDYMDNQGLPLQTGLNVLTGHNLLNLVARLGVGIVNTSTNIHSLVLFCLSSLLLGCSLLLLRVASNITGIIVLFCVYGAERGGMVGVVNTVPIDLAGVENSAIAVGLLSMLNGILAPVGGLLIGWGFDSTGSYNLALDVCGYLVISSTVVTLIAFGVQRFLKMGQYNVKIHPNKETVT